MTVTSFQQGAAQVAELLAATFGSNCPGGPIDGPTLVALGLRIQAHLALPHAGPRGETGARGATGETGQPGARGFAGDPGLPPTTSSLIALINSALQALGSLVGERGEVGPIGGLGGIGPIGPVGPEGPAPVVPTPGFPGGRVLAGGTLNFPLILGSEDDPAGVIAPIFPAAPTFPGQVCPPCPTSFLERIGQATLPFLRVIASERQRSFLERQARRIRQIQQANENAARAQRDAVIAAVRGRAMSFGQTVENIARTIGTIGTELGPLLPIFFPDRFRQPQIPGFPSPTRQIPSGPLDGIDTSPIIPIATQPSAPPLGLPQIGGGGAVDQVGTLFKMTPSGRIRALNKAAIMAPDGQIHFFLHAVPKGWKVNVRNVSGRTAHHHHPRRHHHPR